jgi:endonuclease/exonuclease/phosphatase family metal-dependent hydrolase
LLAIVAGGTAMHGSDRRPVKAMAGTSLAGPAPIVTAKPTIRVGSFNIHGGRGADGKLDLERTTDVLRGMDIVCLNEVRGPSIGSAPDQAQALGESLGLSHLFAPTEIRWWQASFGNGLLASLPTAEWRTVPLRGTQGKGYRNYVLAEFSAGSQTLHVLATHIDRRADRESQLATVFDAFLSLPEPALLLGDLNSTRAEPLIGQLLARPGVIDCIGSSLQHDSPERVDWIVGRGVRVIEAGMHATGASDHPCVWAEVEVARGR